MKEQVIEMYDNRIRSMTLISVITIFVLIVLGGIVRATGSGGACLDWPTCIGAWTPPDSFAANISYSHRLVTFLVGIILLISVVLAFKRYRFTQRGVLYYLSATLFLIQVGIGRMLSFSSDNLNWISSIHFGISLLILGLMTFAYVRTFVKKPSNNLDFQTNYQTPFAKLSIITLFTLTILFVSGVIVAGSGAQSACISWPICEGLLKPTSLLDWVNIFHRLSVIITGILILSLLANAWRSQKFNSTLLVVSTAVFVLFFSQALLASQMAYEYPIHQLILHESTAVAVWVSMIVLVSYIGVTTVVEPREHKISVRADPSRLGLAKVKDLLMLTKPIVVALLLVTTYAGMVIGSKELPSLALTFWTLLGGFMAAGGSGAINQYIDRFDDFKMQRTQKRPIPAGRLTPAEGLAFGVAMALVSFYIMVAFVNLTAALLSLAGIIYYVLIYSMILKKTTVQNIVIGGGAGAIPPLVGWAAATGGLNIPSLFLFVIVFMWTPPHFWALALVRRKDYARAGVPMLPVVRGEKETRWQIFLYTIELVAITILLPVFGLGSSIYLIGAVILGLWLLSAAWRVWKRGGNKSAWKMYRYSSMYLAFLFGALMLDALI